MGIKPISSMKYKITKGANMISPFVIFCFISILLISFLGVFIIWN